MQRSIEWRKNEFPLRLTTVMEKIIVRLKSPSLDLFFGL